MTNYGAVAILAELRTHDARLRTIRAVSVLIALETFPGGPDGWRDVGTDELCERAALTRNSYRRARDDLIGAKLVEYQPGTHRGEHSRWRITFPVDDPPPKKGATQGGHLMKGVTQGGHLPDPEGGHTRPQKGATPAPGRGPHPSEPQTPSAGALASADAAEGAPPAGSPSGRAAALEPSALKASALRGVRRALLLDLLTGLGADDTQADLIATGLEDDPDIHDPVVYALKPIGEGDGNGFLQRMLRAYTDPDPPRPPKPPWCGECDQTTRLAELPDGKVARCIRCHPLSVERP